MLVRKKLAKVQNTRTDLPGMLEALDAVSVFYNGNAADARRSLRADLEAQSASLSQSFLDSFESMREQLQAVEGHVQDLDKSCGAIRDRLQLAEDTTVQFASKAGQLREER